MRRLFKPYLIFPTEEESCGTECSPLDMTISGVGSKAVASAVFTAMLLHGPERLYVLAGIAGQYDGDMAPGTVVAVATERFAGPDAEKNVVKLSYVPPSIPRCDSITVSKVGESYGKGMIENMEGASFATICKTIRVKCAEIRAISNTVGDPRSEWKKDEAIRNLNEFINEKILK